MNIDVLELGPMDNCTYLISKGVDALLIDPGWDMNYIEHTLTQKKLNLLAVLFTHGHFDHILGVRKLAEKTGAPVWAGCSEVNLLGDSTLNV